MANATLILAAAVLAVLGLAAGAPSADGRISIPLGNAAQKGLLMPLTGLGTGGYGSDFRILYAYNATRMWMRAGGYRIDTALAYEDQPKIAQAIADEGFGRADVWLTSKMPVQGYNATHANMDAILAEFARGGLAGVTDVDLLLLHHPEPSGSAAECQDPHNGTACRLASWQAMLELFAAGKAKAIGVSNYEQRHLDELVAYSQSTGTPLPAVLQSELHPYWHEDADGQYATQCGEPDGKAPRRRLVEWATAHGIVYNSYSPLGAPDLAPARDGWNSTILALPLFERLAAQYGKSPAQIVLRWAVQRGIPVNPRSHNATHMRENLDLFGWALSDADMLAISTQVPAPKAPCKTPPDHCCAKVCADSFSSP